MTNHHCADRATAVAASALAPDASSTRPKPEPTQRHETRAAEHGAKHPPSDQSRDAHTRRGSALHQEERQPVQGDDHAGEAETIEGDPRQVERGDEEPPDRAVGQRIRWLFGSAAGGEPLEY